jgi:hypothetical protein
MNARAAQTGRKGAAGYLDRPDTQSVRISADPANLRIDAEGKAILPPVAAVAGADRMLLNTPLQALATPLEMAAWGAAQARAGQLEAAEVALTDALGGRPHDPQVKQLLAMVCLVRGKLGKAKLLARECPGTPISVFISLSEEAPAGFQKAIEYGASLTTEPSWQKQPALHIWLARAYARKWRYGKSCGATEADLSAVKQSMLREIDAAIAADPGERSLLYALWRPGQNEPLA